MNYSPLVCHLINLTFLIWVPTTALCIKNLQLVSTTERACLGAVMGLVIMLWWLNSSWGSGYTLISEATAIYLKKKKIMRYTVESWSRACNSLPVIALLNMLTNASVGLKDTLYSQSMCWSLTHKPHSHKCTQTCLHISFKPSWILPAGLLLENVSSQTDGNWSALLCMNKGIFFSLLGKVQSITVWLLNFELVVGCWRNGGVWKA